MAFNTLVRINQDVPITQTIVLLKKDKQPKHHLAKKTYLTQPQKHYKKTKTRRKIVFLVAPVPTTVSNGTKIVSLIVAIFLL